MKISTKYILSLHSQPSHERPNLFVPRVQKLVRVFK